jgi:hypothetical protein
MPVQYVRDDTKRRIRVVLTEPVTAADFLVSVEQQLSEGAWQYGTLIDARTPFVAPRPSEMRAFASAVHELITAHGPRGPVAVVAKDASAIASAQLYLFFGGRTESLEVFWDLADAEHWLDDRMALGRRTHASD